jgi:hypothetical protein
MSEHIIYLNSQIASLEAEQELRKEQELQQA